MIWSILAQLFWLGLDVLSVLSQSEREKTIEVLVLRQQLRIVERKQRRAPRISRWEKLTLAGLTAHLKGRDRLTDVMLLFKPETALKWHRALVRRKWTFQPAKRRAGHADLAPEVEALIVQLARDNPRLGYKKLVGELRKLGYRVGRSTVRDVLAITSYPPLNAVAAAAPGAPFSTATRPSCWRLTFSRWKRCGCRPTMCCSSWN